MSRERNQILGGLSKVQVSNLPKEVREARATYIADSGRQIDSLFDSGVTEFRSSSVGIRGSDRRKSVEKDDWTGTRRSHQPIESLDRLADLGYQVDQDGTVHFPADNWDND